MVRLRFLTILICLGCLSGGITGLTTASTIQAQEEDEDPVVEVYVPDPGGLSWSPDGQHIVFNYAWATYVMDQDASNLRWITSDYPFRWMPDSHAFITFSYIPGTYQMEWWRTPIDGTGRQRIFAEGASGTMPVYAPNGHRVAFYGRFNEMESDALWIADVLDDGRTENPILVADALLNGYFVWDITWSTTRDELTLKLLQNATRRYYFMTLSLNQPNFPIENLNQVKMQRLESDDDHLIDLGGDWSLEYDPQRSNSTFGFTSRRIFRPDGSVILLQDLLYDAGQSPDERWLVYVSFCDQDEETQGKMVSGWWTQSDQAHAQTALKLLNLTDRTETTLVECGSGSQHLPAFSPDSSRIVFAAFDPFNPQWHIYQTGLTPDTVVKSVDLTPPVRVG